MTASPTTNIEAWHLVHDGIAAGLTRNQIAARYGLSLQMVHHWSRMTRPPRGRNLGGPQRGPKAKQPVRLCVDCGAAAVFMADVSRGKIGKRCGPCDRANQRASFGIEAKRSALLEWANTSGRVPTVTEARTIIGGGSRSCAGTRVTEAFGPDPLRADHRRKAGPRPWPPA